MYVVTPRGGLIPYFAEELTDSMKYKARRGVLTIFDTVTKKFLGVDGEWKNMNDWLECPHNLERFPSRGFYI